MPFRRFLKRAQRVLRRLSGKEARPAPLKANPVNWKSILESGGDLWETARRQAEGGPRILLATYVGGHPQMTVLESALAAALTQRGAHVDVLLCDGVLPACLRTRFAAVEPDVLARYRVSKTLCRGCMAKGEEVFNGLGLEAVGIGQFLTEADRERARTISASLPPEEVPSFRMDGWPLGEHALAGALRFYGRGDLESEPEGDVVLRRYLEASILTALSLDRLLGQRKYVSAVVNHGIYVPHGVTAAVCRSRGVRVTTWNLAYRKQCAIFSHDDTYHHTLMNEPVASWEDMTWSDRHEQAILRYLDSRQRGSRDWIWFNNQPDEDMQRFSKETGLDWNRPVIGLLTNVVWDAQLHYPANAFKNMIDWALQTIGWFEKHPDLQLLIRIHPGELAPPGGVTKSRQPMAEEIARAFPTLPRNVFIIPPESSISTYATMQQCDSVIIYGTKTGVELTSRGVPVIVAGEAWIRNKGLTLDAATPAEYFEHLERLPLHKRAGPGELERARKYAYHFFFRRMVPLPFLEPAQGWPPFVVRLDGPADLAEGRHPGLDVLCDGILNGKPFIYPAEQLGVHDQ